MGCYRKSNHLPGFMAREAGKTFREIVWALVPDMITAKPGGVVTP
jgi:hypothetical protein